MSTLDLTDNGERELYLWVMNDEGLYNMRYDLLTEETLTDIGFKFTSEQYMYMIENMD